MVYELKGWHSRGYLPHFDGGSIPQMLGFRLEGSLPAERIRDWKEELDSLPPNEKAEGYRERVEEYLDRGTGQAWLGEPAIGSMVEEALIHFDGQRYALHAWVVMPNHVHALLTPVAEWSLSAIVHSFKSFTAKRANQLLQRSGEFWQADYFDRYVRHERQFYAALNYIEENPVKAGLVRSARDWPFSSARFREGYVDEF